MGLATRGAFKDARNFPAPGAPSLDGAGLLRCGAAVGTRDSDRERVKMLWETAAVDAVILDSSQGDSTYQVGWLGRQGGGGEEEWRRSGGGGWGGMGIGRNGHGQGGGV